MHLAAQSLPFLPSINLPRGSLQQHISSDSVYSASDTRSGAEEDAEETVTQDHCSVDICAEIEKLLEDNPVGPNGEFNYVPHKKLKALLQKDSIERALGPLIDDKLVQYILDKAQRTFATLTMVFRHSPDHRNRAMQAFHKAGFTDELSLGGTFERCPKDCEAVATTCNHYFPSERPWGLTDLKSFESERWRYLVPDFDYEVFQYEFHHQRILPWKSEVATISAGVGAFSEVTCVKMIGAHQNLLPVSEDGTVTVAHKHLKPMYGVPNYNIDQEWRREAKAHRELNGRSDHLVRGVAAYQLVNNEKSNTYHILLEWANGGSLSSFWKANPTPQFSDNVVENRERVKALLNQIRGLIEALECMHFGTPSSRRSSVRAHQEDRPQRPQIWYGETAAPMISVEDTDDGRLSAAISDEVDDVEASDANDSRLLVPTITNRLIRRGSFSENWRHGDIKPDNILRFTGDDDPTWLGTLKLADLGRAQLHELNTAQRNTIERERWRTRWYEPPDLTTDLHQLANEKISRLFDIWSMGCVIFESVIWMLYGWDAIEEFQGGDSTGQEQFDTPYWSKIAHGTYRVTGKATSWFEHIEQETFRYSGALKDLIQLVRNKLLIVALPPDSEQYTPGYRTNARDLGLDLEVILEKADKDNDYLFSSTEKYKACTPPKETPAATQPYASGELLSPNSARRPHKGTVTSQVEKMHTIQSQKSDASCPPESTALLPKPKSDKVSHATRIARDMVYTDDINDEWQYLDDRDFATKWIAQNEIPEEDELCQKCDAIDPMSESLVIHRSDLEDLEESCTLCDLKSKAIKKAGLEKSDKIRLVRVLDTFVARETGREDIQIMRLCSVEDSNSSRSTPKGAPALSEPGRIVKASDSLIKLARAWLDECETHHHGTCNVTRDRSRLPKRLLDVKSNRPKIIDSADIDVSEDRRYIAFSHKWGEMPESAKTTKQNLSSRRKEIPRAEIPQSFSDAIAITKALGSRYLWIDCLCINQGRDGDFAEQSGSMQTIFSNAYCVLAAASAEGATKGFWARNAEDLPTPVRKGDVFMSAVTNDFTRDVLQSPLNQRGWVLQEHALARRTIFFTENQMYWECGDGIRCETLRKLRHDVAGLLGDADFPSKTIQVQSTRGTQIHLWTRLFQQYSALDFSYPEDRSVAIEGLLARLTTAFRTQSLYGVFESFWGRCLLWKRAQGGESLKRIRPGEHLEKVPPSWSWMASEGLIDFLDPEGGAVAWNTEVILPFPKDAGSHLLYPGARPEVTSNGIANVGKESEAIHATAYGLTSAVKSLSEDHIHYDNEMQRADGQVKAVIICTSNKKNEHHVLLVSAAAEHGESSKTYERAGVACLPETCIDRTNIVNVAIE